MNELNKLTIEIISLIHVMFFLKMQVLTPSSGFLDFAISMRPDYHEAIIDTIRHYGWEKIIYLYDSHDGKFLIVSKISFTHMNIVFAANCKNGLRF